MMRGKPWILALVTAALLAGCASGVKLDAPAPVEDRSSGNQPIAPANGGGGTASTASSPATESRVAPVATDLPANTAAGPVDVARIIRFDYDSFVIKPDYQAVIEGHARFLKANPSRKIALEGHTDDRGGRAYNLALGQKRSEAVRKALALLGVPDAQMEAVSFGKEKPANPAATEAAFAENRRAEIVYR